MKKLIILIILLFGVCGCWNYKELDDYSIINGIAIDKDDDEMEDGTDFEEDNNDEEDETMKGLMKGKSSKKEIMKKIFMFGNDKVKLNFIKTNNVICSYQRKSKNEIVLKKMMISSAIYLSQISFFR